MSKTNIPVMINGKVRGSVPITENSTKEGVKKVAMTMKSVREVVTSGEVTEVIYIPNRFINFVIKTKEKSI